MTPDPSDLPYAGLNAEAIGAALTINYAIDCYKDLAPEVMLSVMLVRNTLSFAVVSGRLGRHVSC